MLTSTSDIFFSNTDKEKNKAWKTKCEVRRAAGYPVQGGQEKH